MEAPRCGLPILDEERSVTALAIIAGMLSVSPAELQKQGEAA